MVLAKKNISVSDISGSWEEWWTYDGISGNYFVYIYLWLSI